MAEDSKFNSIEGKILTKMQFNSEEVEVKNISINSIKCLSHQARVRVEIVLHI